MGYNPFDDYTNYDQQGLASTASFKPQMNGPQYGGLEYQNYQAPQSGLSSGLNTAGNAAGAANPLLGIGLKGVGALAQLLKRDPYKNTRKTAIRGLEARANNPLNVTGLLSRRRMAIMHDASRFGEQGDRFNRFDKGRSFGEFTGNILDQEAGASVDLDLQNEKLKNEIAMFLAQVRG